MSIRRHSQWITFTVIHICPREDEPSCECPWDLLFIYLFPILLDITDIQHHASFSCTTWWFDMLIYCQIISTIALANITITSHDYYFLFLWEYLRSTLSAAFKCVVDGYKWIIPQCLLTGSVEKMVVASKMESCLSSRAWNCPHCSGFRNSSTEWLYSPKQRPTLSPCWSYTIINYESHLIQVDYFGPFIYGENIDFSLWKYELILKLILVFIIHDFFQCWHSVSWIVIEFHILSLPFKVFILRTGRLSNGLKYTEFSVMNRSVNRSHMEHLGC